MEPQGSARETLGLRELFCNLLRNNVFFYFFIFRNLLWGSVKYGHLFMGSITPKV